MRLLVLVFIFVLSTTSLALAQTAPLSIADFRVDTLFLPPELQSAAPQARLLDRAFSSADRLSQRLPPNPFIAQFGEVRVSEGTAVQVLFDAYNLIGDAVLVIATTEPDAIQFLRQNDLEASSGQSAYFPLGNGTKLTVAVLAGPDSREATVTPGTIRIASPPPVLERAETNGAQLEFFDTIGTREDICDVNDDRVAAADTRVGRIMPVGCTGWLIAPSVALTAGHCVGPEMSVLEFNVPASNTDGSPHPAAIEDQYPIRLASIVSEYLGVGNDWAVFKIAPNSNTTKLPTIGQAGYFQVQRALPTEISVIGYGLDSDPAGSTGTLNAQSQTEQQNDGEVTGQVGSGNDGIYFGHRSDTLGGNSGSPVIDALNPLLAVGIHTNGGCLAGGGHNAATSFQNDDLMAAINAALAQP